MPSRLNRQYPVVKDVPDHRDMKLVAHPPHVPLPPAVDMSMWVTKVKDQGPLGACTAFSWSSVREFLYHKYYAFEKNKTVPAMPDALTLSPLFLYYMERMLEGTVNQDSGAQSRTGAVALHKFGVCQETQYPYVVADVLVKPTPEQITEALDYTAGAYHRIPNLLTLKSVIASGYPASIGFLVYESFESDAVAANGLIPIPAPGEDLLGGHEVTPFGYDDNWTNIDGSKGAIHFLNSWGPSWGAILGPSRGIERGTGWIPYGYWSEAPDDSGLLVSDMWTQHLGKPWVPKT